MIVLLYLFQLMKNTLHFCHKKHDPPPPRSNFWLLALEGGHHLSFSNSKGYYFCVFDYKCCKFHPPAFEYKPLPHFSKACYLGQEMKEKIKLEKITCTGIETKHQ